MTITPIPGENQHVETQQPENKVGTLKKIGGFYSKTATNIKKFAVKKFAYCEEQDLTQLIADCRPLNVSLSSFLSELITPVTINILDRYPITSFCLDLNNSKLMNDVLNRTFLLIFDRLPKAAKEHPDEFNKILNNFEELTQIPVITSKEITAEKKKISNLEKSLYESYEEAPALQRYLERKLYYHQNVLKTLEDYENKRIEFIKNLWELCFPGNVEMPQIPIRGLRLHKGLASILIKKVLNPVFALITGSLHTNYNLIFEEINIPVSTIVHDALEKLNNSPLISIQMIANRTSEYAIKQLIIPKLNSKDANEFISKAIDFLFNKPEELGVSLAHATAYDKNEILHIGGVTFQEYEDKIKYVFSTLIETLKEQLVIKDGHNQAVVSTLEPYLELIQDKTKNSIEHVLSQLILNLLRAIDDDHKIFIDIFSDITNIQYAEEDVKESLLEDLSSKIIKICYGCEGTPILGLYGQALNTLVYNKLKELIKTKLLALTKGANSRLMELRKDRDQPTTIITQSVAAKVAQTILSQNISGIALDLSKKIVTSINKKETPLTEAFKESLSQDVSSLFEYMASTLDVHETFINKIKSDFKEPLTEYIEEFLLTLADNVKKKISADPEYITNLAKKIISINTDPENTDLKSALFKDILPSSEESFPMLPEAVRDKLYETIKSYIVDNIRNFLFIPQKEMPSSPLESAIAKGVAKQSINSIIKHKNSLIANALATDIIKPFAPKNISKPDVFAEEVVAQLEQAYPDFDKNNVIINFAANTLENATLILLNNIKHITTIPEELLTKILELPQASEDSLKSLTSDISASIINLLLPGENPENNIPLPKKFQGIVFDQIKSNILPKIVGYLKTTILSTQRKLKNDYKEFPNRLELAQQGKGDYILKSTASLVSGFSMKIMAEKKYDITKEVVQMLIDGKADEFSSEIETLIPVITNESNDIAQIQNIAATRIEEGTLIALEAMKTQIVNLMKTKQDNFRSVIQNIFKYLNDHITVEDEVKNYSEDLRNGIRKTLYQKKGDNYDVFDSTDVAKAQLEHSQAWSQKLIDKFLPKGNLPVSKDLADKVYDLLQKNIIPKTLLSSVDNIMTPATISLMLITLLTPRNNVKQTTTIPKNENHANKFALAFRDIGRSIISFFSFTDTKADISPSSDPIDDPIIVGDTVLKLTNIFFVSKPWTSMINTVIKTPQFILHKMGLLDSVTSGEEIIGNALSSSIGDSLKTCSVEKVINKTFISANKYLTEQTLNQFIQPDEQQLRREAVELLANKFKKPFKLSLESLWDFLSSSIYKASKKVEGIISTIPKGFPILKRIPKIKEFKWVQNANIGQASARLWKLFIIKLLDIVIVRFPKPMIIIIDRIIITPAFFIINILSLGLLTKLTNYYCKKKAEKIIKFLEDPKMKRVLFHFCDDIINTITK